GLYRNIYGIQPRYDRLLLEPHLVPELNGTELKYSLRGQSYLINLSTEGSRMTVEDFTVQDAEPFALHADGNSADYFFGNGDGPTMSVSRSSHLPLELRIEAWSDNPTVPRRWTQICPQGGLATHYIIANLQPAGHYQLRQGAKASASLIADPSGRLEFTSTCENASASKIQIVLSP